MADYSLKLTIRNGRILAAIRDAGYKSQADFARQNDLSVQTVNELVAMRRQPVGEDGRLVKAAQDICDALCALPEDLWTEQQLYMNLSRNSFEREMSEDEAFALVHESDMKRLVSSCLSGLKGREAQVLRMRFGIGGEKRRTLLECGHVLGVTGTRIRDIEAQAMRKLRHHKHSDELLEQINDT